jgi:hypothetical protein
MRASRFLASTVSVHLPQHAKLAAASAASPPSSVIRVEAFEHEIDALIRAG